MAEDVKTIPTKGTFPCTCCVETARYCCLTCGDILCVECQRKHLRCNASRGHKIKLIQPRQYTFGRKNGCKPHSLPFKFWCKDCETSLCYECDGHRTHDVISFEYLFRIQEEIFEKVSKDLLFSWQTFLGESKDMTELLVEQRHQIVNRAEMFREVLTQIEHKSIRKLQYMEEDITQRNKMYRKRLEELKKEIEMKRYDLEFDEKTSNLAIDFSIQHPPKVKPSKFEPGNLDERALLQMFGSFSTGDDQPDSGVWMEECCTSGCSKDAFMVHYSLSAFPHLSWINSRVEELHEILIGFDTHSKFRSTRTKKRFMVCGINLLVVSSNLQEIKSLISDESPDTDGSWPLKANDMKVPLAVVDMRNVSPIRDSDISLILGKIERSGYNVSHGIVVNESSFVSKLTLGEDNVEIVPSNKKRIRCSITSYIEKSYVDCLDHIDKWCDINEGRSIQVKYKGRCISIDEARDISREIRNSIMQPLTTIPQPDQSRGQQIQKELIEDIKSTLRTNQKQKYLRGYGLMLNGKLRIDITCPEERKRELQHKLETLVKRYGQCPEIRFGNFTVVTTIEPGDKIIPNPTKPDSYGTIGTIAKATGNKLCAVTCRHVAIRSNNQEMFIQNQATVASLGTIKYSDIMQDFAAIEIDGAKDREYSIQISDRVGKRLNSTLHTNKGSLEGQQVFKKGASSGITRGVVVSDGYTWSAGDDDDEKRDEELILVRGSIEDFGIGGDSGSIVYRYDPTDPDMDDIELISMFQGEYTDRQSETVENKNEKKEIATKRLSRSVTNAGSLNLTFE